MDLDASTVEHNIITEIVSRATEFNPDYERLDCYMDITACHLNGTPLNLSGLLAADGVDFVHDVYGIRRHINRETGRLTGGFTPRYALKQ